MEKCQKRLVAALILITAAALCGAGVILLFQISRPVFFYNYGSYQMGEDAQGADPDEWVFTLKYIANVDDRRTVSNIEFPEADVSQVTIAASEQAPEPLRASVQQILSDYRQPENMQNVGRYAVHSVTVTVTPTDGETAESVVLHEAKVHFSDRSTRTVSIGCVGLYRSSLRDSAFSWCSGTSYGGGATESTVQVNEPITLERLEPLCPSEEAGYIQYQVNGVNSKQIVGMQCQKGDTLRLHWESTLTEDAVLRQNDYNIPILMHYRDEQGEEHTSLIDLISRMPAQYRFWDLVRYLKAGNAL